VEEEQEERQEQDEHLKEQDLEEEVVGQVRRDNQLDAVDPGGDVDARRVACSSGTVSAESSYCDMTVEAISSYCSRTPQATLSHHNRTSPWRAWKISEFGSWTRSLGT